MGGLKLREPEYTTIKQLLAKGYDGKKVAEIMGRGTGTVSTVKNTKDYTDYLEKQKGWHVKEPKRPNEQLPLRAPKEPTVIDLRQSIWIKWGALYDELSLYRRTPTGKTTDEQRDLAMAITKLEEAEMWLKRHW